MLVSSQGHQIVFQNGRACSDFVILVVLSRTIRESRKSYVCMVGGGVLSGSLEMNIYFMSIGSWFSRMVRGNTNYGD